MGTDKERRLTIGELAAKVRKLGLRSPSESAAIIREDRDDPSRGMPLLKSSPGSMPKGASGPATENASGS
ncbi:MAG: hypothetical protein FJ291_28495 [Planctomycetes bacterium]|nr:hypothetical protein [Planctomycetota bacterium]